MSEKRANIFLRIIGWEREEGESKAHRNYRFWMRHMILPTLWHKSKFWWVIRVALVLITPMVLLVKGIEIMNWPIKDQPGGLALGLFMWVIAYGLFRVGGTIQDGPPPPPPD